MLFTLQRMNAEKNIGCPTKNAAAAASINIGSFSSRTFLEMMHQPDSSIQFLRQFFQLTKHGTDGGRAVLQVLAACLRRMMRISRGVTEAELEHTVNWHFSLDGLQAANDRVLRLMDRLELPNLARRLPDQLHTSSDGQKFEVRVDSLNANYSFKYFGKDQGVAAYTFRDERDLLWYSTVFSSAERESAYVIDGLMHNEVVKSDIHSTDAFGFSELVFAVSHLLGFSYAPRFKNLERQRLYIFRVSVIRTAPSRRMAFLLNCIND